MVYNKRKVFVLFLAVALVFQLLAMPVVFATEYQQLQEEQILNILEQENWVKGVQQDIAKQEQTKKKQVQAKKEKVKAASTQPPSNKKLLGTFALTAYCTEKREHICGTGDGITASGKKVTAGKSIAVDPSVIPLGTKVYIEGVGMREAQDTGGAIQGSIIDVALPTHKDALAFGRKYAKVYIVEDE